MKELDKLPFRLHYRKAGSLIKIALIAAIALTTAALLSLRINQWITDANIDAMRGQAAALEQETADLKQAVDELGTLEGVRRVAEEELDLVDPGTVIIKTQ